MFKDVTTNNIKTKKQARHFKDNNAVEKINGKILKVGGI